MDSKEVPDFYFVRLTNFISKHTEFIICIQNRFSSWVMYKKNVTDVQNNDPE